MVMTKRREVKQVKKEMLTSFGDASWRVKMNRDNFPNVVPETENVSGNY